MPTSASRVGRRQKISSPRCLPSNRQAWRPEGGLPMSQNTTTEFISNDRLRSSRRPLVAIGFSVHARPADCADTQRHTPAHRTRCSPLQSHARAWWWGSRDTQPHTTATHTRDRTPPGCHVYGGARDSRGNSAQTTASRNIRTPSSLRPPLLTSASVPCSRCTR